MATYVKDENRGYTLHLLKLDCELGGAKVYLDASRRIKEAQRADRDAGYKNGGPRMGLEVEKARSYADYVAQHVTQETVHHFHTRDYSVFTERATPAEAKNAGTLVSV
jgi:chloramphenicol 3-O-phosphotransferase